MNLKVKLIQKFINLVEDIMRNEHVELVEAIRLALSQVIGALL